MFFINLLIVNGLNKHDFKNLLELTAKDAFFMFDNDLQADAMWSPLGSSLAISFMCHYETTRLNECPASIKPVFYWCYVDDGFCLFNDSNQCDEFLTYMNTRHANIKFTLEREKDESLSF